MKSNDDHIADPPGSDFDKEVGYCTCTTKYFCYAKTTHASILRKETIPWDQELMQLEEGEWRD